MTVKLKFYTPQEHVAMCRCTETPKFLTPEQHVAICRCTKTPICEIIEGEMEGDWNADDSDDRERFLAILQRFALPYTHH
jgi:hypothetical protein